MAKASSSGFQAIPSDVPKMLAMLARGDREHDVAAWYGLNSARIAEVKRGEHGTPALVPESQLPPSGSPAPKARQLRVEVAKVHGTLTQQGADGVADAITRLEKAMAAFDKNTD